MIIWKFGLEHGPSGERLRQIPTRAVWSSSQWCSKSGDIYRRFFNPIKQEWNWNEKPQRYSIDSEGRLGIYILDQWVPITTCIALAWLHRLPGSPKRTITLDSALPPHVDNIRWVEMGTPEEGGFEDEVWKPLKWRIGIRNCPTSYKISTRDRIKAPTGEITSGYEDRK